ncbi:hypothetical protein [Ottowia sp.]|uniref:hypothetical protein n=1 Tax=Ottowia sp. TaxID=1898956 RepID=UPI002600BD8E|nr:hypothetical protein [Ottowia sp.]MBK6616187.1 hypothetical protein [Ottowia sp.]
MQTKQILLLVIVGSILLFVLSAYALWAISRRKFNRTNDAGIQLFRSHREMFWVTSVEDVIRRTASVSLPAAVLAAMVSIFLLNMQ